MFKDDEVDPDLRNIAPGPYSKLENFFIEKVEFEIRLDELDAEMKSTIEFSRNINFMIAHCNNAARLNKNRLNALKERLHATEIDI